MSRNLACVDCDQCHAEVNLTGKPYPFARNWPEYDGMIIADAECSECRTRYTAWIGRPYPAGMNNLRERGFYDLSYRSTFNDEPGDSDLPPFGVDYLSITREIVGG